MPTLYFPLLLLVFFAMFGANPLESAASVGVGYAWARGYLDPVVPSDELLAAMEQWPAAAGLVRARGYVSVAAAGPTLPSTSASAGVVNSAGGTQPGRDSVNDLIAQLRDHAFAGGARSRGARDGVGAGGAGRRLGGEPAGVGTGAAAAAAAASRAPGPPPSRQQLPASVSSPGSSGASAAARAHGPSAAAGGGSAAQAQAAAVAREPTREERAEAFARAHEKRLREQRAEQSAG